MKQLKRTKSFNIFSSRLFKLIAKRSILPATIFSKIQISKINRSFAAFWGISSETPLLTSPSNKFSTVTLGEPIDLWTHYFPTEQDILHLRTQYSLTPLNVHTKDGAILCGMHFQNNQAPVEEGRTLIIFGGNGDLYRIGTSGWLFKLLQTSPIPFHLVLFDYRECGNSRGNAYAKGLVLDGEAIYSYVHKTLGVCEDQIDLCGFSLGAAIATLVKARHKDTKGCLISNRSFQSLDRVITGMFSHLLAPISRIITKAAFKITHSSEWILNPFEAWKTIQSRKMVICHDEDPVITHCASMERALYEEDLLQDCHHIRLNQKCPKKKIPNHHVEPLSSYNDHHGNDVESTLLEFLLDNAKASQDSDR